MPLANCGNNHLEMAQGDGGDGGGGSGGRVPLSLPHFFFLFFPFFLFALHLAIYRWAAWLLNAAF